MVNRIIKPLKSHSFFLFGARGVGKSTWVRSQILTPNSFTIDLLQSELEDRYSRRPDQLIDDLKALSSPPDWIFIDEVQKIPKLLDIVHLLIEQKSLNFILTGSSSRKLKRGQANLLAGRSFLLNMFPLTHYEWKEKFDLLEVLEWGSLPGLLKLDYEEKRSFLKAYTQIYLKEEIQMEQIVRKLTPFRAFLEVSAQSSGKIINASKIARDVGVDTKTVQNYFSILEDTLIGFFLPAFHASVRKSQKVLPKFYYFDTGVKRSLERALHSRVVKGSYSYGDLFEHFILTEAFKLNHYLSTDYKLSFFQTTSGGEVDLILSRGQELILVEIKSTEKVDISEVKKFNNSAKAFHQGNIQKFFISNDKSEFLKDGTQCCHWKSFFQKIFPLPLETIERK